VIDEIAQLMGNYQKWLEDRTALRQIGETVEITTPFLNRHNDYIQIYVRKRNGGFILSDEGETIEDLKMSGVSLDTPKRKELLRFTAAGFGISTKDDVIFIETSPDRFPLSKHNLVQTILAVNDLFFTARPIVASLFLEEVKSWLEQGNVRYTPDASFTGKTGYPHKFHFTVPKSRAQPERLIRAINNPNKDAANNLAFAWIDTKEERSAETTAMAILNDGEQSIPSEVEEALSNYDIESVKWSGRESVIQRLAA